MITLLTQGSDAAKLAKTDGQAYHSAILYLASGQYDSRLCPAAGACKRADLGLCLVLNSGRTGLSLGQAKGPAAAKINRTHYYFDNPVMFKAQLRLELFWHAKQAIALGLKPAARLNGGSDIDWSDIYSEFPNIQFWEYTKRPDLAIKLDQLPNVSVTYSYSENTVPVVFRALVRAGINIAVVFDTRKGKPLPAEFRGLPIVDGDLSDFRFLDSKGMAIGLRFKSARNKQAKVKAGLAAGFIQKAS